MNTRYTRRIFLRRAGLGAAAVMASPLYVPGVLHAANAGEKIRLAVIGCGGRGRTTHVSECAKEKLVALVDPDASAFALCFKSAKKVDDKFDSAQVKTFDDYRKLFDAMHKEIDAVTIASPNHQHALPAMIAMKLGKHVYVEKPLCHEIWEGRELARLAAETKVVTQMGNQGHSGEGYRRIVEAIQAGCIGKVTEVYHWTNRCNGGVGPRPPSEPPPKGMTWDTWIGPAPYRDYHDDLHPHEWHGWHDFGNGALGNLGCHVMDGAQWALNLVAPNCIECEDAIGGTNERYPVGTRVRWEYAARGDMPPLKVWWFDGRTSVPLRKKKNKDGVVEVDDSVDTSKQYFPPIKLELEKKYNRTFKTDSGTFYVGDKGILYSATYGNGVDFVPDRPGDAWPEKTIPRIVKMSHHGNWFNAIKTGTQAVSNFAVAQKLNELVLLGHLSTVAGKGRKLEWDGNQFTNAPEMNRFLKREYRKGWEA